MSNNHKHLILSILIGFSFISTSLISSAGSPDGITSLQSKLEGLNPPLKAKSIKASPLPGLYEVFVNGNIIYTDSNFSHAITNGSLIEIESKKNLTEDSLKQLTTIKFLDLPLKNAIEIKKGSGNYKFAIFSDPDCPSCKDLEISLDAIGISDYTAYVFLLPLRELHPDAAAKAESIWCSKNRSVTWSNFMVKGTLPKSEKCDNPISANEALAENLGISATPTIYLNNGQRTYEIQDLMTAIKPK